MTDKAEALRQALRSTGFDWPAPIRHFETVASTNDVLKDAARSGAPEWSVAFADEQTAGRGRLGNLWISLRGNLFLSVLLRPATAPQWFGLVPLAGGVAAARTARDFGAAASLKWPNDVWVNGRKLAGILVEAHSASGGVEEMVLGCGMNVAVEPASLPGDLAAASLRGITGADVELLAVAASFLRHLQAAYALVGTDPEALRGAWKELSVPWWGRRVEVGSGDGVVAGVLVDLAEGGGLVLETGRDKRVVVVSGEARAIRLA